MTLLLLFAILFLLPLVVATALHFTGDRIVDWRNADRSSAGLLPPALPQTPPVVRIFSARTVRWRGIVATHSWIVIKDTGAASYSRFDYTAWGEPIWVDRFIPDGRWFGRTPELVFAADGAKAERMIPLIREAVRGYALSQHRRLSGLAGTELEHLCRRGAGNAGCTSPHRCRQGLSD
jgi:hypothetical protein